VSTILKALKKLEQERDALRPSGPLPVFSKPSTGDGMAQRWRQASRLTKWACGIGVLFVGLVLLYLYAPSRNERPLQTRHPALAHKPPPLASANPDRGVVRPAPPPAERSPNAKRTAAPAQVDPGAQDRPPPSTDFRTPQPLPRRQPAAAPAKSFENSPSPEQGPAPERPAGPSEISRRDPTLPPPVLPGRSPTPRSVDVATRVEPARPAAGETATRNASAQSPKPSADTYDNSPTLTDGRLKVHAIAWSAAVEDRMAVINSRVVHEGDSVDGFAVVAIRPEDVVVREKEKGLYRVVFGRP
jgi:hypothetical protein